MNKSRTFLLSESRLNENKIVTHIHNISIKKSTYTTIFDWKVFLAESQNAHQFDSTRQVTELAITLTHHEQCFRHRKGIQKMFEAKINMQIKVGAIIWSFFRKKN